MKKLVNIQKTFLVFITILIVVCCLIYKYNISAVSSNSDIILFEVTENQTILGLSSELLDNNLIRSEMFYKLYVKLFKPTNLQAGIYSLSEDMDVKEIIDILSKGTDYNANLVNITFVEGFNMLDFISLVTTNTSITEDEIKNLLKDENYIDSLITKYWFLTDEIKDEDIYYSLEGYLYPNTYEIDKTWSVNKIIELLLDEMENKLEPYKEDMKSSEYSVHELITLASIIELESGSSADTAGIAGTFYNRLEDGWTLGSDVTTYYAEQKDFSTDLTDAELNDCNAYNTRGTCFVGLPVGPISNPSIDTIKAVIYPTENNYYYFVADKNGKTYFSKTSSEHTTTVAKLKSSGLWYEYD